MNKEEDVLIGLLWQHYTDGEIRQMEHEIVLGIPPPEADGREWLDDALDH
jgi:hypothetical protein